MLKSQYELQNKVGRGEQMAVLNEEMSFLDIDSLVYYQNLLNTREDEVFGRNIFNNKMLTFEPNANIATPSNYKLGAGDHVYIDVWGASQETFEGTVSPDGTLYCLVPPLS